MEPAITTKPTTSSPLPPSTTEIVTRPTKPTKPLKPTVPTTATKPTTTTTFRPTITTTLKPTSTTTLKPATSEYFKVVCYFTNWAWYRFVLKRNNTIKTEFDLKL